ncbi:D-xylose ABC transporter substrate-binding protein [Oceanobacillus piezotolerans]|uniref:D-xylose ABC transporter substrate-binding protein n=1 Tax=Oceanobacillus piezotolerans TaxID=2448030 RepID=A0A498DFS8_9BACI|nr:substrate-binding domain-containing protein [Oceanobacillus piezotolerans]RLL48395.1 D-xylose ABC transporter substrate-binding protein [Oceanobacillus piezotolerans]
MKTSFIKGNILLLMLLLLLLITACEQNKSNTEHRGLNEKPSTHRETIESHTEADDKIIIGFSMDTLAEDRWVRDRELFRKAVEALGAEVKIFASEGDDALQILQAETLINEGIDLLVIVPHNAESTAMIVKKAHSAGIKVLSYDRLVRNSEIDFYISYDNEMVGEFQANVITEIVPKGKYVYIGGAETDYNAHLIKKGVFNVLHPLIEQGDITIVYDQWSKDWLPENAYASMEEALKANKNDIDAVIAANDATAGKAIQALAEQGLEGKVAVAGQDADLAGAQRIVIGTQTLTVYKPLKPLADLAAEVAVKLAKGEEVMGESMINNGKAEVPSILLSPIVVDRENIDDTIIADGFHSKQEVYKGRE